MNDYDFLWNGQHTRCAETVVTFGDNGEPTKTTNPKYRPNDQEYVVCRLLGWCGCKDPRKIGEGERWLKRLNTKAVSEGVRV